VPTPGTFIHCLSGFGAYNIIYTNNNNNNNKQTFQGRTINKSRHKGAGGDYNPRR